MTIHRSATRVETNTCTLNDMIKYLHVAQRYVKINVLGNMGSVNGDEGNGGHYQKRGLDYSLPQEAQRYTVRVCCTTSGNEGQGGLSSTSQKSPKNVTRRVYQSAQEENSLAGITKVAVSDLRSTLQPCRKLLQPHYVQLYAIWQHWSRVAVRRVLSMFHSTFQPTGLSYRNGGLVATS